MLEVPVAEDGNWDQRRPQHGELLACECKLKSQERDRQKSPRKHWYSGTKSQSQSGAPRKGGAQSREWSAGQKGGLLGRSLSRGQGALDESSCGWGVMRWVESHVSSGRGGEGHAWHLARNRRRKESKLERSGTF